MGRTFRYNPLDNEDDFDDQQEIMDCPIFKKGICKECEVKSNRLINDVCPECTQTIKDFCSIPSRR